jgi:multiple sugar transport system ATP-binding protein
VRRRRSVARDRRWRVCRAAWAIGLRQDDDFAHARGSRDVSPPAIFSSGERVNDVPTQHRDLAMVFQSYALYPHMTIAENIGYPLRVRKLDKVNVRTRQRVAAMLEIESLLERKPRQLSGGERQRVALARAIVREPRAYLMDEPLSNLDARLRVQMRGELKRLQHQLGTTTIYVTHDQAEAMTLASRVAVMKKGRLQQFDTPMNIYNHPANRFVAEFVGSPSMNFIDGRIEAGTFDSGCEGSSVLGDRVTSKTVTPCRFAISSRRSLN